MITAQQESEKVEPNASTAHTACVLCYRNCGLVVNVEDNKIRSIKADKDNPFTKGYTCNKAYSVAHYVNHKQRLQFPLKKTVAGNFERISWGQAIKEIAQKLTQVKKEHGPESLAMLGLGGQANHLGSGYGLGFLQAFGGNIWYSPYAQEKSQHHWVDNLMAKVPPDAWFHPDVQNTEYMLIMGSNPLVSNSTYNSTEIIKTFVKDPNKTMVVVDPRRHETARRADIHLPLKPGTDVYLLIAMIKHLLQTDSYDRFFIEKHVADFKELKQSLESLPFTIEELSLRCRLSSEIVKTVAQDFAKANSACVVSALGVEHCKYSTLVSWLIRILTIITGNYAQKGGNHFVTLFGADSTKVKKEAPQAKASGMKAIHALGPNAIFSPSILPEEIDAGQVKAVFVDGCNPLLSYTNTKKYRQSLQSLDLLVVIELSMTETAQEADYVLPTPAGYEKWDWTIFPKGFPEMYVHLRHPVVTGPAEALPEAEIYSRLISEMSLIPKPPKIISFLAKKGFLKLHFVLLLLNALFKSRLNPTKVEVLAIFHMYQTIGPYLKSPSLAVVWLLCHIYVLDFRKDVVRTLGKAYRWASPFKLAKATYSRIVDHPEGVEVGCRVAKDNLANSVKSKGGKITMLPIEIANLLNKSITKQQFEKEGRVLKEYPLHLIAGERTRFSANTIIRGNEWRKGNGPHCWVKINPQLAKKLNIEEKEVVWLETHIGRIDLPVVLSDTMPVDVVSTPHGFGMEYPKGEDVTELETIGRNINLLSDEAGRDPISGAPHLKNLFCKIYKM